tara:strand:- start:11427 stop:12494 length:1068 start_codon:yes stop_codon:yes gene_type:complete
MDIPKGQTNSLFNSPGRASAGITNTATNAVRNTASTVTNTIKNSVQNMGNKPETIIGLIIVIIFAGIVAWLMYRFVTSTVFNQSKLVVSGTKIPILCNKLNKLSLDYDLPSGNGLKRTYTFWIYIKDMAHQYFKNVLYIGNETQLKDRSPQIFLDKQKNKLFIRFSKKQDFYNKDQYQDSIEWGENGGGGSIDEFFQSGAEGVLGPYTSRFKNYMKQGVCIEYVPIQRWVHIGIVINDYGTSTGGSIATYVDGDLVGIAGHGETMRGLGEDLDGVNKYDITNLDLDKNDNLIVGGEHDPDSTPGFAGLLCKFTMFNYDLNDRDIHNNYNEGPIDNFMAKLGLGAYGVRNPIYKMH